MTKVLKKKSNGHPFSFVPPLLSGWKASVFWDGLFPHDDIPSSHSAGSHFGNRMMEKGAYFREQKWLSWLKGVNIDRVPWSVVCFSQRLINWGQHFNWEFGAEYFLYQSAFFFSSKRKTFFLAKKITSTSFQKLLILILNKSTWSSKTCGREEGFETGLVIGVVVVSSKKSIYRSLRTSFSWYDMTRTPIFMGSGQLLLLTFFD